MTDDFRDEYPDEDAPLARRRQATQKIVTQTEPSRHHGRTALSTGQIEEGWRVCGWQRPDAPLEGQCAPMPGQY
jgi:hypothetical protein